MGEKLDRFLRKKYPLAGEVEASLADIIVAAFITAFALLGRMAMFPYESGDYTGFLAGWFSSLKAAGGFPGVGLSLGDYTPPYIYIMSLLTYLPLRDLYSIKLVSVCFDLLLAAAVLCVVYRLWRKTAPAIAAYGIVLFLPTVFFNSAFWAQCDSIFTAFLVLCVCCFLREKPFAATVCFAVAFTFKLQAVFLAPFLVAMWIMGRMKGRHFLLIPAVYLVSILPAWVMGRSFTELLTIYLTQTKRYSRISLNAPNLYYFIYEDKSAALSTAAIMLCGAAVVLALYLLYRRRPAPTGASVVTVALFFALLLPYLLPHMHERYFYVADVLALCYAFCRPKRFYLPVLVVFASTACYLPFLFGHFPIDLRFAALVMTAALLIVTYDLFGPLWKAAEAAAKGNAD